MRDLSSIVEDNVLYRHSVVRVIREPFNRESYKLSIGLENFPISHEALVGLDRLERSVLKERFDYLSKGVGGAILDENETSFDRVLEGLVEASKIVGSESKERKVS